MQGALETEVSGGVTAWTQRPDLFRAVGSGKKPSRYGCDTRYMGGWKGVDSRVRVFPGLKTSEVRRVVCVTPLPTTSNRTPVYPGGALLIGLRMIDRVEPDAKGTKNGQRICKRAQGSKYPDSLLKSLLSQGLDKPRR